MIRTSRIANKAIVYMDMRRHKRVVDGNSENLPLGWPRRLIPEAAATVSEPRFRLKVF